MNDHTTYKSGHPTNHVLTYKKWTSDLQWWPSGLKKVYIRYTKIVHSTHKKYTYIGPTKREHKNKLACAWLRTYITSVVRLKKEMCNWPTAVVSRPAIDRKVQYGGCCVSTLTLPSWMSAVKIYFFLQNLISPVAKPNQFCYIKLEWCIAQILLRWTTWKNSENSSFYKNFTKNMFYINVHLDWPWRPISIKTGLV